MTVDWGCFGGAASGMAALLHAGNRAGQTFVQCVRLERMSDMVGKSTRRVTVGKVLVGFAVLAPAALVVGVYLILQGRLYGYHFKGPLWPWFTADLVLLLAGMLLLRGQDL